MEKIIPGKTRVILPQTDGNNTWFPTATFPVWGSHLQSIGTVTAIHKRSGRVEIQWDNGSGNNMPISRIEIVGDDKMPSNPNMAFRHHKALKRRGKYEK